MRTKDEKKRALPINSLLIIIGTFFFFNPNLSVLDVLPDFIGAILIVVGFLHLADIDDRAKDSKKALIILAIVDAGKMLTLLLLTDSSETVWPLIFTFCFGLGEGALFVYGMAKLFSAVTYQAMRHTCLPLYEGFSSLLPLTVLIAILKNLLVMLPELTGLSTDYGFIESIAGNEAQVSQFVYKALTVLNLVVVALYGIGWWIYMLRYFRVVGKQKDFLAALDSNYYAEVGSKHEVMTYRALKTAGLLFTLGLILLLPLRLDGNDILPDFAGGALLLLGILRLFSLYKKKVTGALISGGVYTAVATAEWVWELLFNMKMDVKDGVGYYDSVAATLLRHPKYLPSWFGLCGLSILKSILLVVFLFFICTVFAAIIRDHTGASTELAEELGVRKTALIQKGLFKKLNLLRGCAIAAGGAEVLSRIFRMFPEIGFSKLLMLLVSPLPRSGVAGVIVQLAERCSDAMLFEYLSPALIGLLLVVFLVFHAGLSDGIDNKYYCARE
ncbi:MAG: hypothetical protein J6M12_01495 [Clostridia bacterium]|nr:hypothetical protein [Clostridia bacterium]